MKTIDRDQINAILKYHFVNVRKLCSAYGVNYKTFFGWLSGRQKSLNRETTQKVLDMMDIYRRNHEIGD